MLIFIGITFIWGLSGFSFQSAANIYTRCGIDTSHRLRKKPDRPFSDVLEARKELYDVTALWLADCANYCLYGGAAWAFVAALPEIHAVTPTVAATDLDVSTRWWVGAALSSLPLGFIVSNIARMWKDRAAIKG